MDKDVTYSETKQWAADNGYKEVANNTFVNQYGETIYGDGKYVREAPYSKWYNTQDEDSRL